MELHTKEILKMITLKVLEFYYILTDPNTLEASKKESQMERENYKSTVMVEYISFMKEILLMDNLQEKVNWLIAIKMFTKDIFKEVLSMVKGHILMQTAISIQVSSLTIRNAMIIVNLSLILDQHMKEEFKTENFMEKESCYRKMEIIMKENISKERNMDLVN